jgi:uncharacterized delta-60 repeat protein
MVRAIITLVAAVVAVAAPAQAATTSGWVLTDFASPWYWHSSGVAGLAVLPDGRIVAAGSSSVYDEDRGESIGEIALARYNPDLSLDTSFSGDGKQTTAVEGMPSAYATNALPQADGKLVVAGGILPDQGRGGFLLARYGADGSLDGSFGDGGIVTTDRGEWQRAHDAVLQPDGKILVSGEGVSDDPERRAVAVIARYRPDGSLDGSFGGDGIVKVDSGEQGATNGETMALQADGKLVVGGGAHLFRVRPDGSLDTSFGIVDNHFWLHGVAVQADGGIVVAGGDFALARYRPDGSLDTSFQASGVFGAAGDVAMDVAIQADGRIVAAGLSSWYDFNGGTGGTNLLLARLNANGSLDPTFDPWAAGDGPDQSAATVALMPNGTIVFGGAGNTWDDGYFGPQRFLVGRTGGELVATITGGPAGLTSDSSPVFEFTVSGAGAAAECRLDGPGGAGGYAPCTSPKSYSGLADGDYTFSVRAVAGTASGPAETRSFTVSTRPPEATITSGPSGPGRYARVGFEFSAISGSTFECKLDGPGAAAGSYARCSSPAIYDGLADGNYAFSVRATAAGRTGPPATRSFSIDTVAPVVTITGGPSGTTSVTSPRFSFTVAGGPIASVECNLIGPANHVSLPVACTSPYTVGPLAAGDYRFSVWVADTAGNSAIAVRAFTIAPAPTPTPAPSCAATNGADVQIRDFTTVESPITIAGCPRNASAAATVEVHIVHTYIGDLVVSLVAPDGTTFVLHNRAGGSTDNINQTYTVNLAAKPANGTWKLRVQDAAGGDVGRIDSWTLSV